MSQSAANYSKPLNGNGAWADYSQRKRERSNHTYRIDCNGGYYLVNGQRMEENEFNSIFSVGLINRSLHPRLDSRQELF